MKSPSQIAVLLVALLLASLAPVHAQKYACVNTDYILRSIPDYASAQRRLDKYVTDWQKELQDKQDELDAMRADYEQESYLLPDNLRQRRLEEIREKEQAIKLLQHQRFGADGDLDKKRAELLKPVQDRVYAAIERIAHEKNYAFVFDRAGSPTVLYANKKYDISDDVLELLGYRPGATAEPAPAAGQGQGQGNEQPGGPQKKPANPEMRQPQGRDIPMPLGRTR